MTHRTTKEATTAARTCGGSPEARAHTAYWAALDLGYSTFAAMAMAEAVREMHASKRA